MTLALRGDFDAARLRVCARQSEDDDQLRRLLALAAIYDGASRADAAEMGGVTRQIVRDWVERFKRGWPRRAGHPRAPGKPPLLSPEQRAALAQAVEDGPAPGVDGVVRWRLADLVQWVWERFAVSISRQTLGRELRSMSYRKFLRDNWLSNRVFTSYNNIVDHCCYAWNSLVEQPWIIMSIRQRDWKQEF